MCQKYSTSYPISGSVGVGGVGVGEEVKKSNVNVEAI